MNLQTAEQLLSCFRPDRPTDNRVEKAVRVAESDATLKQRLEAQQRWDSQLVDVIRSLEPPEQLRNKLSALAADGQTGSVRKPFRKTGMLAVVLGIVVMAGLIIFFGLNQLEDFEGKEAVTHMLDVTRGMNGAELEPVQSPASQLGDWFYMRGFEGFTVPPELASLRAVGSRVFRPGGGPVAQVAVDPHNAIVFVFRAVDFGVAIPETDDWHQFEHEGWAAAIRRQGPICSMISFRGTRAEMKSYLDTLKAK